MSESDTTLNQDAVIEVEVAFATPDKQVIKALNVPVGATMEQAVEKSGILDEFPEIDLAKNKMGIFGKLGKKTAELKAGDRVEIYRPLIADPKESRRKRAAKKEKREQEQ